jgi:hypothetical protein
MWPFQRTHAVDPRRRPRVPARLAATVAFGAGRWELETEDVSEGGFQFVSRLPLRRGEAIRVQLRSRHVPFALDASGTVAWTSATPPFRTGVAFATGEERRRERFVKALLAAEPALSRRDALALDLDQPLRLWTAPADAAELGPDEVNVIFAIRRGATARQVLARAGAAEPAVRRALLMLLARRRIRPAGPGREDPRWARLLGESAPQGYGAAEPVVLPPLAATLGPAPAPRAPAPAFADVPADAPAFEATGHERPARRPGQASAGGRPARAQAFVDLARAEQAQGRVAQALTWLRAALQLAPGDPEISALIGALAFDGREPGARR